jgi:hypothetical protein
MGAESDCHFRYWDEAPFLPSVKTVLCTIATIVLTIALEIIVHSTFKDKTAVPQAEAPTSNNHYATPHTRATRLAIATIIYPFVLTMFILRIIDANAVYIAPECRQYVGPNWIAISFLNILPFACATSSFFRAVLDCILVRFDTGLSSNFLDFADKEGPIPWTPLMPLFAVCIVLFTVFECVKIPIAVVMGKRHVSAFTRGWNRFEDMRAEEGVQGEEGSGLVGGMESADEDEGSSCGPPAYDEIVRPLAVGAVKERGDGLV